MGKDAVGFRAGSLLSLDEVKTHLAALVRLENVGLLLGSGASKSAGGQTIADLWKAFLNDNNDAAQTLVRERFIPTEEAKTDSNQVPNIEILADALEIARLDCVRRGEKSAELEAAFAGLKRAVIRASILNSDWWDKPGLSDSAPELASHRRLLQRLCAARQPGQPAPWIFTTNYDLAIEWASEAIGLQVINGFSGLHSRRFSPNLFDLGFRNTLARGEARFGTYNIYLAKLHGSLSWVQKSIGIVESSTDTQWAAINHFLNGGEETKHLLILPRAAKYVQTTGFIYGEIFRRFSEFLAKSQVALIVNGYSFSDDHINRVVISALQNPTLQVVIYIPTIRLHPSIDLSQCSAAVAKLVELESAQVTFVGNGASAYFASFVNHLPDPVIFDEHIQKVRDRKMSRGLRHFGRTILCSD